jgi:uroporphyrinogen-III synthase
MSGFDGFAGLRVLALESRRAADMAKLIAAYGGVPLVVPALVERTRGASAEALAFASQLVNGDLTAVIFLTGTGTRMLATAIEGVLLRPALADALNRVTVVARGPKPTAALRELGVAAPRQVPKPHTWREILQLMDDVAGDVPIRGCRVAVQEYGVPSDGLLDGLRQRGALVSAVPVYEWALPEDLSALHDAVTAAADGRVEVLLFTAAVQVHHLARVAEDLGLLGALRLTRARRLVASIGPATSEALRQHGIAPDLEASQGNIGVLVLEAARRCRDYCGRPCAT